ncbi:CDP-glycerol glycerophosphotransferase family protein [Xylanibacter ruminicola]|uniref:CDP-glycerol glycerophosphotransferase family protein n=1 Tax=Xylanibacter ruminicola TaxID=839 RepID=UPI00048C5024|nr:CDP-glycerol glycerophosphotransferase family protein [Xylanibacter ruminicola]
MNGFVEFGKRLKFVKIHDLLEVFPMIVGFLMSIFVRIKYKNLWLICERPNEARDNGYWFFKYMCEYHPEIDAVYAIDSTSVDYPKVSKLGKTIPYGSLKHWAYYFAAKRNISSQKEGKPNAALCFILEVYLGLVKNRAYIRHGICKDNQEWINYRITKINLIFTSAKPEHDLMIDTLNYPEKNVALTGLCRYDNLLSDHEVKRQILVMPTMREWLRVISSDTLKYEKSKKFTDSEYFLTWSSLLHSEKLKNVLEKYNIKLLFFPHSTMQKYLGDFNCNSQNILIADARQYDVQQLLMESAALITDYSSIYFDFAYMKKPLIYYQFDYDKYRKGQYQEGYFVYKRDGFGPVVEKEDLLVSEIENIIENNMQMPLEYKNKVDDFFAFHDTCNCKRTFDAINNMK